MEINALACPSGLAFDDASWHFHRDGYRNALYDHLVRLFDTDTVYTDFVPDANPTENGST